MNVQKQTITVKEDNRELTIPKSVYGLMRDIQIKSQRIGQDLTLFEILPQLPDELQKKVVVKGGE